MHILQSVYVGNTVCTARTDERKEVGGQEVENKRSALSDLSDCLDYMQGKKRWRRRRGAPQESLTRPERPTKREEGIQNKKTKKDKCGSGREEAVNIEKRLQRCAPGKARKQKRSNHSLGSNRLWHLMNIFNRFTAALKEYESSSPGVGWERGSRGQGQRSRGSVNNNVQFRDRREKLKRLP